MLEFEDVLQADLRGGVSPWQQCRTRVVRSAISQNFKCEVLVVGAGITGSLVAEHLASLGYQVCIIDRERPGYGSTVASTAMLQWEIDRSLSDLTELYGFERAANIYRRSVSAVSGLVDLVHGRKLQCGLRHRHSLYLAAGKTGARELSAEHELRKRAGLPGEFLDHSTLLREFGFHREGAIVSPGSADADPLLLSQALLGAAIMQGVKFFDAEAHSYDHSAQSVIVEVDGGRMIDAKQVVLATGYVMPDFLKPKLHKIASSWAIATLPQEANTLWRDGVLVWEASKDYHYARTTLHNRIIIGGEDDDQIVEPEARDKLIPQKAELLLKKLGALWPNANAVAEFSWSGAFGTTSDGLPLIGPVPKHPRVHAAYGYGGNGITFSYLASRMIAASISGNRQSWFDEFAIDRDNPQENF